MIKIEQSLAQPEVWFLKLQNLTVKLSKDEVLEVIEEARRINKFIK